MLFRCVVLRGTCIVEDPKNLSTKTGRIVQTAAGSFWVNTDRDETRKKLIAKPVPKRVPRPVAKPVAMPVPRETRGQRMVRVALVSK